MSSPRKNLAPEGPRAWRIRVPGSSANLGPGFDVLGLALSLYTTLDVRLSAPGRGGVTITYSGEGADAAPRDPHRNLITRVALYVLRCHGVTSFPTPLSIDVTNEIPFGRGLGSSGTAVVAGVLLADAVGQLALSDMRKLDFALMVERHPENVAAALLGGFTGAYLRELSPRDTDAVSIPLSEVLPDYPPDAGETWGSESPMPPEGIGQTVSFGWADEVRAVVVIPNFEVSTAKARGTLLESYPLKDCIFNLQRVAVLTTLLTRSPPDAELIYAAMQDRLHQPCRASLIPGLPHILATFSPSTHPGLLGICLSGAGPSILALATGGFEELGRDIARVWYEVSRVECEWRVFEVAKDGAVVTAF